MTNKDETVFITETKKMIASRTKEQLIELFSTLDYDLASFDALMEDKNWIYTEDDFSEVFPRSGYDYISASVVYDLLDDVL